MWWQYCLVAGCEIYGYRNGICSELVVADFSDKELFQSHLYRQTFVDRRLRSGDITREYDEFWRSWRQNAIEIASFGTLWPRADAAKNHCGGGC